MYSLGTFPKNLLFDFNVDVNGAGVHFDVNQYNSIDGVYNKLNYIVADYTGDWVILMLPNPIILTKYSFIARSGMEHRAPGEWKCYGSNDGSTFIEITEASNLTRLTTTYYTTNNKIYTKNI